MDNIYSISIGSLHEPETVDSLSRTNQRAFILHVLYSYHFTSQYYSIDQILYDYGSHFEYCVQENGKVYKEICMIIENISRADEIITKLLKKWPIERISVVVLLVLRYALAEFLCTKNDSALIINEAIELAKGFAEENSFRLINGVLDAWVKQEKELPIVSE